MAERLGCAWVCPKCAETRGQRDVVYRQGKRVCKSCMTRLIAVAVYARHIERFNAQLTELREKLKMAIKAVTPPTTLCSIAYENLHESLVITGGWKAE